MRVTIRRHDQPNAITASRDMLVVPRIGDEIDLGENFSQLYRVHRVIHIAPAGATHDRQEVVLICTSSRKLDRLY